MEKDPFLSAMFLQVYFRYLEKYLIFQADLFAYDHVKSVYVLPSAFIRSC